MHTFYCYSHASVTVSQDKVLDFLASALETALLKFMALTGDFHKPERLCLNAK